jgi:hypothetical protein
MQATNAIGLKPATGRLDVSRFPASGLPQLLEALTYLRQSATMRSVLRRLIASGNIVFVTYHPAHTKFLFHNPGNLRIQWNPFLGLQDVTGYLSPSLLLGHELGHAQFTPGERCAMHACERPQGFQNEAFGVEEACVIATVEQPAARELNAARRRMGLAPLETANRCQHQLGRLIDVSGPLGAPTPAMSCC